MKHLLSDHETLQRLCRAKRLGIFLDFDGTLVPLAPNPREIQVPEDVMPLLTALAAREGYTVGIITGRTLPSLSQHLRAPSHILIGASHGLEWVINGSYEHVPLPDGYLAALKRLYAALSAYAESEVTVSVYWKELSLSTHLRRVPAGRFADVKDRVLDIIRNADPGGVFSVVPGRTDLDVRPSIDWTKASVLTHFLNLRHIDLSQDPVIYIGDDTTDEDVFRAFPSSVTVHVGAGDDTKANYFLKNVAEVLSFLHALTGT